MQPTVFFIDDLLSDDECDMLLRAARPKLQRSETVSTDKGKASGKIRVSQTAWLSRREGKWMDNLFRRFADIFEVREEELWTSAESLQIVNYNSSNYYEHHHDWFQTERLIGGNSTEESANRLATILINLNDLEGGGHTHFPKAQMHQPEGLYSRRRKGSAILFYSMWSDGNLDDWSRHGGLTVTKGEKWIANVWLHDPFVWVRPRERNLKPTKQKYKAASVVSDEENKFIT